MDWLNETIYLTYARLSWGIGFIFFSLYTSTCYRYQHSHPQQLCGCQRMPSTGWPITQTSRRLVPFSLRNSQSMGLKSHCCLLYFSRYKGRHGLCASFTYICIFLEAANRSCSKQDPLYLLRNDNNKISRSLTSKFDDCPATSIKGVSAFHLQKCRFQQWIN